MLQINPTARPKAAAVHRQAFAQYLRAVSCGTGRAPATATQLEIKRLAAWGKVLQLARNDPSTNAIGTVCDSGDNFRSILTNLLEKLDLYNARVETGATESPAGTENAFPIGKPLQEMIQELIGNLCDSLPVQLQAKLSHVWQEDSLATDNREDLQNIELSSQSAVPQYLELRALLSTRRGNLQLSSPDYQELGGESLLLDSNALLLEKSCESYQVGWYNGKQVFVEYVHMVE